MIIDNSHKFYTILKYKLLYFSWNVDKKNTLNMPNKIELSVNMQNKTLNT